MAAMLEQGFDEPTLAPVVKPPNRSYNPSPLHQQRLETVPLNRWDPNSSPTKDGQGWGGRTSPYGQQNIGDGYGYADIPGSGGSVASSIEPRTPGGGHAKKRSGGRGVLAGNEKKGYGPLGPLEDDDDWGGKGFGGGGKSNGYGGSGGKGKRV